MTPSSGTAVLRAELSQLKAERDIRRRLLRYGVTIDGRDVDGWVGCFTADGVFEVLRSGLLEARIAGRDALRDFIEAHSADRSLVFRHCIFDSTIDVRDERADALSYFIRLDDVDGRPALRVFGQYRDELIREGDGSWRIARRTAEIDSFHAGSGAPPGWARDGSDERDAAYGRS